MSLLPHNELLPMVNLLFKFPPVVLYIGPDQIMPLTSVLGAVVGLAIMFWNRLVGYLRQCREWLGRRPRRPRTESAD